MGKRGERRPSSSCCQLLRVVLFSQSFLLLYPGQSVTGTENNAYSCCYTCTRASIFPVRPFIKKGTSARFQHCLGPFWFYFPVWQNSSEPFHSFSRGPKMCSGHFWRLYSCQEGRESIFLCQNLDQFRDFYLFRCIIHIAREKEREFWPLVQQQRRKNLMHSAVDKTMRWRWFEGQEKSLPS